MAEKAIEAGCDILLIPTDLNTVEAVKYYDEYIARIADLVEKGVITEERIDGSVNRILTLKERHGILKPDENGKPLDERIAAAAQELKTVLPENHPYSDDFSAPIENADVVIGLCAVGAGLNLLQDDSPVIQGIGRALICQRDSALIPLHVPAVPKTPAHSTQTYRQH